MLRLCHHGRALLTFRFQTDLVRENSASYLKIQAGKTDAFSPPSPQSRVGHALRPILSSDRSKFDR